jgi:hypothetical protein
MTDEPTNLKPILPQEFADPFDDGGVFADPEVTAARRKRNHREVERLCAAAWKMDPSLEPEAVTARPSKPPDIHGLGDEDAADAMVEWFRDNFEDPAENTPFHDGAYVYIRGEPCDAHEELDEAFSNAASEAAIDLAVEEIEHDGDEWVPSSNRVGPEPPANNIEAAKQGLFGCLNSPDDRGYIHFSALGAATLLHELIRLQKLERAPNTVSGAEKLS